jgi:hypothetical protein
MALSNVYCSLADVKASLRIVDGIDDAIIERAIESATDTISLYCDRSFLSTTGTRIFAPDNDDTVQIDDLVSVTSVKISSKADGVFDITLNASDYQLEPLNGYVSGISGWPATAIRAVGSYTWPYLPGRATVQVVGTCGWSSVPRNVRQATILQSNRVFKRNDSPMGVISSPDLGYIRVGSKLDPDVAQLLEGYRLMRAYL